MSILINILLGFNVIVSLLIILLVLMQRPKSEGLGAAFGGGMTENLFGAQTTNVLANATRWLGGVFFALTLLLSILYSHQSKTRSSISEKLANAPKPVATATPAATPAVSGSATTQNPVLEETTKSVPTPAATAAASATPAPKK